MKSSIFAKLVGLGTARAIFKADNLKGSNFSKTTTTYSAT
jgi:hypothetical protein